MLGWTVVRRTAMGQLAKIKEVIDEGTLIALRLEGEGVGGTFFLDGSLGRCTLENLQADAITMAAESGLPHGYLGYLDVDFEAEGWGGMTRIAPVSYDAQAHLDAVKAIKEAQKVVKPAPTAKRI